MLKRVNPHSISVEQMHKEMRAAYDEPKGKSGLKGRFGPDHIRKVTAKVLGRSIPSDAKLEVLRATIELAFGGIKGDYDPPVFVEAHDLFLQIPSQKSNRCKKVLDALEQGFLTQYLPLEGLAFDKNVQSQRNDRKKEVEACMAHLSSLNFFKSPFVLSEEVIIRRFKFKKAIAECRHKIDNSIVLQFNKLHAWLSTRKPSHVGLMAAVLAALIGIRNLVNTPGYHHWKDPYDVANHTQDLKDTTDFCHYFVNYPEFDAQKHLLDSTLQKMRINELIDLYKNCQEFPILSRITYMLPGYHRLGISFITVSAAALLLMKITGCLLAWLERKRNANLKIASTKLSEAKNSKMSEAEEVQGLMIRHVTQIISLATDFIHFVEEEKQNTASNVVFLRYQAIARGLQVSASKIEKSLSWFEDGQRAEIMNALSDAANVALPGPSTL